MGISPQSQSARSAQSTATVRRYRQSPFRRVPQRVPGTGPVPADCMLIGERPGYEESIHRPPMPFVGISGKYLDLCLGAANIRRSSLYVTNLVKSFRDYQKPTATDIAEDHEELICEVLSCNPRVIGLVGAWSVEQVLAREESELDRCHGVPIRVTELFNGELAGDWIVLPMIHPASAAHSPESLGFVLDDVIALGRLLDGEISPVFDAIPSDSDLDYRLVHARDLDRILKRAIP